MEKKNPFKLIGQPTQEVPPELKSKVMSDVNTAKLLMEMAALFTSNYKSTIESLFKTKKNKNNHLEND
jgi:hypothetical protein